MYIEPKICDSHRPLSRDDFEIALMCALPEELAAVDEIVDEFWDTNGDPFGKLERDPNSYSTGRIGKHNVVIVLLSNMGKAHASSAASNIRLSYRRVKIILLVGVCGAMPQSDHDEILLGDVVIGDRVLQHDFGRKYGDSFRSKTEHADVLGRSMDVSSIVNKYKTPRSRTNLENHAVRILESTRAKLAQTKRKGIYDYPGRAQDRLFKPEFRHRHTSIPVTCICAHCFHDCDPVCGLALEESCQSLNCDDAEVIERKRPLTDVNPTVHIGAIASGDMVIKSGTYRDSLSKSLGSVAFEMEASGVWEQLPCLVVKGVCDYADSHKEKHWQRYAAATAASVCKSLILRFSETK